MRGIAMILVILAHCMGGTVDEPFCKAIISFHMPLFFFISGFCFKRKEGLNEFFGFLCKKTRTLLIPQITLGVLLIIVSVVFNVIIQKNLTIKEVDFISPFDNWFLPTLFFAELLLFPIIDHVSTRKGLVVLLFILIVCFFLVSYNAIHYVQQVLCALLFSLAGFISRPWVEEYISRFPIGYGWLALIIVAIVSTYNVPVGMFMNQYGNKGLFLLTSFLGIYGIFDISISIRSNSFFEWSGQKSIILYVMQGCVIRFVEIILSIIIPGFQSLQYPNYLITFVLVLLFLVPITFLCDKYFKFAFGRWK